MDSRDLRIDQARTSIEFLGSDAHEYLPHLAVDCVVFGVHEGDLRILLTHWTKRDRWSLPGGFVRNDESVDETASRVLRMRTGLDDVFLEQFHTFGSLDRGHPGADRFVSVGYYALVDFSMATPTPDGILTDECRWWNLCGRPDLLFDHDEMVARALGTLRLQLGTRPIGLTLFPDDFTLPELQRLYETVLGRSLDRRNFQKKMRELGILTRVGEKSTENSRRAPYLYRFDAEKYAEALERGDSLAY
ncbi:MAG: hydrolase [Gemmatimonadetes bacterium]|nr:hydrolase [Gemmatimonadota bacterium]